jgi:hypothetical protein
MGNCGLSPGGDSVMGAMVPVSFRTVVSAGLVLEAPTRHASILVFVPPFFIGNSPVSGMVQAECS